MPGWLCRFNDTHRFLHLQSPLTENVFERADLTLPGLLVIAFAQCALYGRQATGKVETLSRLVISRALPSTLSPQGGWRFKEDIAKSEAGR